MVAKKRSVWLTAFTCVGAVLIACCSTLSGQETVNSPWDRVLNQAGITRQSCHFDALDMAQIGGGDFRLPLYDALHDDPLRIPFYAHTLRDNLMSVAAHPSDLTAYCASRLGIGTHRTLTSDPLLWAQQRSQQPDALLHAIEGIYRVAGQTMPAAHVSIERQQSQGLPLDVQVQAAYLLEVEAEAYSWRQRALAAVAAKYDVQALFGLLMRYDPNADPGPSGTSAALEYLMHNIDLPRLMAGGEDLALASERASEALKARIGKEIYRFDLETPLGHIALHGAEDDIYPGNVPYLLIIDTGGDDLYYGGGATYDAAHPVSVLIDVSGNDRYLGAPDLGLVAIPQYLNRKNRHDHPCFGAGILGYGILIDLSGNDLYRASCQTMGRGYFGLGLLVDAAGNDVYDAYTLCQGSADFGVGILDDRSGKDAYHCFLAGQGYGGPMGFGLLCDSGPEGDTYEANDSVIDFPSPQTPQHNTSLAQGMGNGVRADYSDGHSLAGGIGVLLDEGGSNHFTAGLFAQGAGYWYGTGLLSGGPGRDIYEGVWYVQGSAAHFGVGILNDVGGNDRYHATMNMAQGAGYDYSVGFLIDDAGNDRYEAPNFSLGSGSQSGFGFFWDRSGDDTYIVSSSTTLGGASVEAGPQTIRDRDLTLGIFLDTGGHDTYPAMMRAAHDGALWSSTAPGAKPGPTTVRGAGLDIEAPNTADPE